MRFYLESQAKMSIKLSLQYHENLNPKLWDDHELKDDVRKKLLEIAEKWQEYARIPDSAVHDIVITGGNVNRNYTDLSDIDVHFLIDTKDIPIKDPELLEDYMKAKKDLWARNHDIRVKGYPIELYAQDINKETPSSQGVFSILNNQWVVEPENLHLDFNNDFNLRAKVREHMRKIDSVIDNNESLEAAKAAKRKITELRGESIKQSGEFAIPNLVFKELRNRGYLQKISDYIKEREDRALSLESVSVDEATYQGREVPLNKPMPGDVKKSKVYVDLDGDGIAKKVNFGDKNMTIKKNIPARRRSFRARHNCDNPGPKDKARYWSCKAW